MLAEKGKVRLKRENRKTKLTKMLLNESFLNLLAQKPLARITVTSICEDADLNRSTYYRYYTDPYDQMNQLEITILDELSSCLEEGFSESTHDFAQLYQVVKKTLDYMWANKRTFQILLSNNGDISLQKDILTVLAEKLLPPGVPTSKEDDTPLQDFIFICSGAFGMVYYWLMIDSDASTEDLAKHIAHLALTLLTAKDGGFSVPRPLPVVTGLTRTPRA